MMNDLISRKQAIDAIRASTTKYSTFFMGMEMYTDDDAVEAIEDLPSAQQWIPVSEMLPDKSNFYICTMKDKLIKTAWYAAIYGLWEGDVIAWMPLPEPYKGEVK